MNAILKVLLEVTVYSSVIAGVLLLLRALFKKKISAKLQYMAWLLLIVRLMVPITVESGVHFFTIKEKPAVIETAAQGTQAESKPVAEAPAQIAPQIAPSLSQNTAPQAKPQTNAAPTGTAKKPEIHITWQEIMVGLWMMGVIALGVFFIRARVRFMRRMKETMQMPSAEMQREYDRICEEMMLASAPELWVCDVASPALMGRRILLPEGLSGQALRYALYHELTHYRRKDHIMVVIMSALRCVYWFNPLVWVSFSAMQTDMEVACDAGVMERIGAEEKRGYLTTLLNMFSAHSVPAIGMAQAESKRAAKARIEGAFRKPRTGRGMRMVSAIAACMILVCCFTTACQPTPEKPIVVNKNDGKLEEKIAGETVVFEEEEEKAEPIDIDESQLYYLQEGQSALAKSIGAPEHWNVEEQSYKIPFGTLNLTVDANVHIPDAKAEVDTVNLQLFTAEQKQAIVDAFFGDKEVYFEDQTLTKDDYIKRVEDAQLQLQVIEEEVEKYGDDMGDPEGTLKEAQMNLAQAQSELAKAPDEKQYKPYTGEDQEEMNLCTLDEKGNVAEHLNVLSIQDWGSNMEYTNVAIDNSDTWDYIYYDPAYRVPETQEEKNAVAIALDAAEKAQKAGIGADVPIVCLGVKTIRDTLAQDVAIQVRLSPVFGGLPSHSLQWALGHPDSAISSGMDLTQYADPITEEWITAAIVDGQLMRFQWRSATEIKQTENTNAEILSFEEISEIFLDNIKRNIYADEGETFNLIVSDVYLSSMLMKKKDSDDYYMMPVWDFTARGYGDNSGFWFYPESSMLTLNAIDGSIIRRNPSFEW